MLGGNSIFFVIGKAEVLSLSENNYFWSCIITGFDIRKMCKMYLEMILNQSG